MRIAKLVLVARPSMANLVSAQDTVLTFDKPQAAGISGFRSLFLDPAEDACQIQGLRNQGPGPHRVMVPGRPPWPAWNHSLRCLEPISPGALSRVGGCNLKSCAAGVLDYKGRISAAISRYRIVASG